MGPRAHLPLALAPLALGLLPACAGPTRPDPARPGPAAPGPTAPRDPVAGLPRSGPVDLEALLRAHPERFGALLDRAAEHRLQLAVAVPRTDARGRTTLERSTLGDLEAYFYPASAIKLAAPPVVLEQLVHANARDGTDLGLDTELVFEPLFDDEVRESEDPTHLAGGRITVGHEVRKLHLVSDNRAFNRLFELAGYEPLNRALHDAGFPSARVLHRLSEARGVEDNRRSPAVELRTPGGWTLRLPERESAWELDNRGLPGVDVGRAFAAEDGLREGPHSFRHKNRIALLELQDLLVEVVTPEVDTGRRGFPDLTLEQRAFLRDALAEFPRESADPVYDPATHPDETVKFLLPGLRRVLPAEHVRVWNKVGRAYGFSVENALVEDRRTGRRLYVAAVLYTNPNGVLNDGVYDYEAVADPYFADLGEVLAEAFLRPGGEGGARGAEPQAPDPERSSADGRASAAGR